MNSSLIRLIITILIIVIFVPFLSFSNSNDEIDIQIMIRSDKEIYRLGEPIILLIEFINKSKREIIINKQWYNPNNNSLQLFDYEDNQIKSLILWDEIPPSKNSFLTLGVKGVMHDKFEIINSYYNIVNPGQYRIRIKYENNYSEYYSTIFPYNKVSDIDAWTGCIFSNSIEINVVS